MLANQLLWNLKLIKKLIQHKIQFLNLKHISKKLDNKLGLSIPLLYISYVRCTKK